jgi:hypothetical protein
MKIEKDQVMLAHRNEAFIQMNDFITDRWVKIDEPIWNWSELQFRIGNLTANGLRLDELVEKYSGRLHLKRNVVKDGDSLLGIHGADIAIVIETLIRHPECIIQVDIVEQEKKLRPWTMKEFE